MQPAIFSIIGQRLIARVDDRAIELHPLINVVHNMIGPLTDLEIDRGIAFSDFEVERQRIRPADPTSACKNLARRKKSEERTERGRGELRFALHQIIFMATEGCAGLMIDVVFDERNTIGYT